MANVLQVEETKNSFNIHEEGTPRNRYFFVDSNQVIIGDSNTAMNLIVAGEVNLAGSGTNGLNISEDYTNYINFNDVGIVGTSIAMHFIDAFAAKVIETGSYSSTASKGITLVAANNRPVSFLFDDAGAVLALADYRTVLSRVCLTIDQSNGITLNAIRGQIKANDGIDVSSANAVVAGVQGFFELAGTGARTLTGHVAAVRAAIEEGASGTTTVAASSFYSGFEATLNSTRTYTLTGVMSAFTANISGGTSKWYYGMYNQVGSVFGDIKVQAEDAAGLPCVIFSGAAATDGDIATAVGADTLWADGSLYISVLDGNGKLFQKQNDTWTDLQA